MGRTIEFDFGIGFSPELDANLLFREYAEFAVDPLYGQNQTIDPTFYPISYFPINPWPKPLPRQYSFASLHDPGVSFGTFIKSDGSPDYILRLFNAENFAKEPGPLILGQGLRVTAKTDLVEETRTAQDEFAAEFKAGELLNVVISQNRKEK